LAKACRQNVWLPQVVPVAVEVLKSDPKAGELYEGELVAALKSIVAGFWLKHGDIAKALRAVVEGALAEFDEDLQALWPRILQLPSEHLQPHRIDSVDNGYNPDRGLLCSLSAGGMQLFQEGLSPLQTPAFCNVRARD